VAAVSLEDMVAAIKYEAMGCTNPRVHRNDCRWGVGKRERAG
jgi:hypothetical protein